MEVTALEGLVSIAILFVFMNRYLLGWILWRVRCLIYPPKYSARLPAVAVLMPCYNEGIYSCVAAPILCTKAGRLGDAVDAEVDMSHPMFGSHLRGVFSEVDLINPDAAKRKILLIR